MATGTTTTTHGSEHNNKAAAQQPPPPPSDDEIVRLCVGGTDYWTTRRTLLTQTDWLLADLLLNKNRAALKAEVRTLTDGRLFIDRDGQLFAHVLAFLRAGGRLSLPENYNEIGRLYDEAEFYGLTGLRELLAAHQVAKLSLAPRTTNGGGGSLSPGGSDNGGGYITVGYRGTFAFGRDGQADVKFRKLHRILVCGKISLCREVFGDSLNESRDPGGEGVERYTSRLYLKHQCLEKACDNLAERGFRLVATNCSGANGLAAGASSNLLGGVGGGSVSQKEALNQQRNSGDYEEQRWAHYTEFVFYRPPPIGGGISPQTTLPTNVCSPPNSARLLPYADDKS